ncbi:hypothetical protein IC006_2337 [Sulfuracidifex tepidarius]|uniref:Uncharacterized protein n=1 Tax=Sulfuracidifex tepidarius TaxID=1294262 RepID=A0A510DXQ4_9CREN|nr:hypothetical protein IC006_2337 [Sulfuracidifex tepidarius]
MYSLCLFLKSEYNFLLVKNIRRRLSSMAVKIVGGRLEFKFMS